MSKDNINIINSKPIKKLVAFAFLEALISALVVFAVLYIIKSGKLEKSAIAYVLTCAIVFMIVLFFAILKILFQARVKKIVLQHDFIIINMRLANIEIKIEWKDIKFIKKTRIKDNVKTNIILESGTKIPVWSTAFNKKDWKIWEDILIDKKFINPVD